MGERPPEETSVAEFATKVFSYAGQAFSKARVTLGGLKTQLKTTGSHFSGRRTSVVQALLVTAVSNGLVALRLNQAGGDVEFHSRVVFVLQSEFSKYFPTLVLGDGGDSASALASASASSPPDTATDAATDAASGYPQTL